MQEKSLAYHRPRGWNPSFCAPYCRGRLLSFRSRTGVYDGCGRPPKSVLNDHGSLEGFITDADPLAGALDGTSSLAGALHGTSSLAGALDDTDPLKASLDDGGP